MSKKPPSSDILSAFSHSVQQRREYLGITQEELAHRCGLHRTYISDIERGGRNLSLKNLTRLAKGLEISVSTLVRWTEMERATDIDLSEAELRDLFNNAPCGYFSFNDQETITRINDRALLWLGYERNELLGSELSRLFATENQPSIQNWLTQLKECGVLTNLPVDLVAKNGSCLPVLISSSAITNGAGHFVTGRCIILDLSEPRQGSIFPSNALQRT